MRERTELDMIIDRLKLLSKSKTKPHEKQDTTRPKFSSGGFNALNRKKKLRFLTKQQRTEAEKKRDEQHRKRLARIPVMS